MFVLHERLRGDTTEIGHLDSRGHALGAALVHQVAVEVEAVAERVAALLTAGWSNVVNPCS